MTIWVIEDRDSFGWYPINFYTTRREARAYVRSHGGVAASLRYRKYISVDDVRF